MDNYIYSHPDEAERRRYALLQAAATIYTQSYVIDPTHAVQLARKILSEVEHQEFIQAGIESTAAHAVASGSNVSTVGHSVSPTPDGQNPETRGHL